MHWEEKAGENAERKDPCASRERLRKSKEVWDLLSQ